jgi:hypothetical protein
MLLVKATAAVAVASLTVTYSKGCHSWLLMAGTLSQRKPLGARAKLEQLILTLTTPG